LVIIRSKDIDKNMAKPAIHEGWELRKTNKIRKIKKDCQERRSFNLADK